MDKSTTICAEFTIPGWILFIASEIVAFSDCEYNSILDVLKMLATGLSLADCLKKKKKKTDVEKILDSDDERSPVETNRYLTTKHAEPSASNI